MPKIICFRPGPHLTPMAIHHFIHNIFSCCTASRLRIGARDCESFVTARGQPQAGRERPLSRSWSGPDRDLSLNRNAPDRRVRARPRKTIFGSDKVEEPGQTGQDARQCRPFGGCRGIQTGKAFGRKPMGLREKGRKTFSTAATARRGLRAKSGGAAKGPSGQDAAAMKGAFGQPEWQP